MKTRRMVIISIIIIIFSLLHFSAALATGIGVAPSHMEFKQALRGADYSQTLYVINPDNAPAEYALKAEGDAGAWLSFYADTEKAKPIEKVTVPADSKLPIIINLTVPDDAASSNYNATIIISGAATKDATSTVTVGSQVLFRATVKVSVEVTGTQKLTGEVTGIIGEDTEINYPFRVKVHFRNTGNVVARPEISIGVYQGDQVVANYKNSETAIKTDEADYINCEIPTKDLKEGDYLAKVTVSLDGKVIASQDLAMKILPLGTLTRDGKASPLTLDGETIVGRVLKVLTTFSNTGQIETPARLTGEVYRDGSLVSTIESNELLVLPRENAVLKGYYELKEAGNYTVKCQVNFGGKLTEMQEISFKVLPAASEQTSSEVTAPPATAQNKLLFGLISQSDLLLVVLAALVVAVSALVGQILLQRRKARRAAPPPTDAAATNAEASPK